MTREELIDQYCQDWRETDNRWAACLEDRMSGIIDPMCDPDKLELRYLITRSTCQLNRESRIVWWKLRQAQRNRQAYKGEKK